MAFDKDEESLRLSGDEIGFSTPRWLKNIGRGSSGAAQAVVRHIAANPKTYITAAALLTAGAAAPIIIAAMKRDEAAASSPIPEAPAPQETTASAPSPDEPTAIIGRGRGGGRGGGGGMRRHFGHRGRGWGGWGGGPWGYDDYGDPFVSPVFIERPNVDSMFPTSEDEPSSPNPKAAQLASLRSQYNAAKKKGDKKLTATLGQRILALTTS
jgi:hypothetical protein